MQQLRDDLRLTAVEAFDDKTEELTAEYLSMQRQLAAVADELLRARQLRIEELIERERLAARVEQLIEILPGAVLVTDADGIITECNACAPDWLGRPLIGADLDAVLSRLEPSQGSDGSRYRSVDGRWICVARRTLPDAIGDLLLLTDDTEAELLRQTVARRHRLAEMGEMSARLAHQVRTPLGAAVLYLSQLQPLLDGYGDAERYIAHGLDRLRDLERLVNDMLLFAGGIESSAEPIELESLIDDVVDTFAPQQNDPFRICWTGSDTPITVLGSRHALRNAVSNLLANALQFTPGDDHVVVSLSVSDRMARIAIRDHGPGVPEEFKDRVFEPFFSTQSAGTGLGLAVVQAVACAHDGRILVNDYPDGAEFVLELPLAVPAAVLEAGSAGIAEPTHV